MNPLTPGGFCHIWDIFSLDVSQIDCNLFKKAFATGQRPHHVSETGNSCHGVEGNFSAGFPLKFLSIYVYISGFIELMTLIWVSLERSL